MIIQEREFLIGFAQLLTPHRFGTLAHYSQFADKQYGTFSTIQ